MACRCKAGEGVVCINLFVRRTGNWDARAASVGYAMELAPQAGATLGWVLNKSTAVLTRSNYRAACNRRDTIQ
jgi:hypothetical protein